MNLVFDNGELEEMRDGSSHSVIYLFMSLFGGALLTFGLITGYLADVWLNVGIIAFVFCVSLAFIMLQKVLTLRRNFDELVRQTNLLRFQQKMVAAERKDALEGVSALLAKALKLRFIAGTRIWAARAIHRDER